MLIAVVCTELDWMECNRTCDCLLRDIIVCVCSSPSLSCGGGSCKGFMEVDSLCLNLLVSGSMMQE